VSPLAIATVTGQRHERRGRALLGAFAERFKAQLVATPPTVTAPIDGLLTRRGELVAVAEAKTRTSYDLPAIERFGTYLVTAEKLQQLVQVGGLLGVPSFVVTELSDCARLYWQVGDAGGARVMDWEERPTRTLATSVGAETVVRVNAFLPLDRAVLWGQPLGVSRD
jgi:hypothetical protein